LHCNHSMVRRTCNHTLQSRLRLPQPGGPGSRTYIPQELGCPDVSAGTAFPSHRLLRLAGLRRRFSDPRTASPRGRTREGHWASVYSSDNRLATENCLYPAAEGFRGYRLTNIVALFLPFPSHHSMCAHKQGNEVSNSGGEVNRKQKLAALVSQAPWDLWGCWRRNETGEWPEGGAVRSSRYW
jgi:hypothetical protein